MTFYARYGDAFLYGNVERLYGEPLTPDDVIRWAIEIDWDGDGIYDGSNENEYAVSLSVKRGRSDYIRVSGDGRAEGFEPVRIGTCNIVLDNTSRRFDPYNTNSDLYPYILPGRFVRVRVDYQGELRPIFHGKIRNIVPIENGRISQVRIEAEDGMRLLQQADASEPIQQNVRADTAIGSLLDAISYPTLYGRSLEQATDNIAYWWATNKVSSEVQDLAEAELGEFFVAADGAATFYARTHSSAPLLNLTAADLLKEINIPQPWEVVRNYIRVFARPRKTITDATLWTLQDTPLVQAGDTLEVWAQYTYNNENIPAINVGISSSDYTANTVADGSGSNVTSDFAVSFTDFGETGKIEVTNNGAVDAYITLLQVVGDAIVSPNPSILITENTTSQNLYGKSVFTLDNRWVQQTNTARDFSRWLISFLPSPQRFIEVKVQTRPDIQFEPDLFDVVNLQVDRLGISQNFKIGGIEHRWLNQNGQSVQTIWNLEPFPDISGFWKFDNITGDVIMGVGTVFGF